MRSLSVSIVKQEDEVLVQARVPVSVKQACEAKFKADKAEGKKVNWKILIQAACDGYLKQRGGR
jgi:hypothetical protein